MPRFVILEHDHPHLHWDLMLEAGEVLRSWRLESAPRPGQPIRAEAIGDHRRAYLDYEGPVSGNRGQVKRWDAGSFTWRRDDASCVEIVLDGARCRGRAELVHDSEGWRFCFWGEPRA